MNYSVFGQMQDKAGSCGTKEEKQTYMERIFRSACVQMPEEERLQLNDMLGPQFCGCSADDNWLTLSFQTQEWMRNPGGTLHGGMLTAAMDMTLGMLARFSRKTHKVVTVQLSVNFMRPIKIGEAFRVYAKVERAGSRVVFLSGKAYALTEKEAAAEATALFM